MTYPLPRLGGVDRGALRVTLVAVFGLGLSALACSALSAKSTEGCPEAERRVPIDYVGGAVGSGELTLSSVDGDASRVAGSLTLFNPPEPGKILGCCARWPY